MRPSDIYSKALLDEMKRLAALPYDWVELSDATETTFKCRIKTSTLIERYCESAHDLIALAAGVRWVKEGPKVAIVTEAQFKPMSKVDVNLEVKDIQLPYSEVLVVMPPGHLHKCVLVSKYREDILICTSMTADHRDDVVTIARHHSGEFAEAALEKYDDEIGTEVAEATTDCLRVALNMLLAMTNYGFTVDYLYQKEVERDVSLMRSKKSDEVKESARERIDRASRLLTLDRTVILHKVKGLNAGEPSGRELRFHWRRGHWRMQPYGPDNSLRKSIFIAPVLVRRDLLEDNVSDFTTTYKT